ncbi:NAD(P)H-dependent oxidoreductase, partial [Candidatus Dojkabacteria bacterium]|nr:NAD(P)H-dependent oxidoreductase [Candidatus Dojkabacteria bacterium]
MSIKIAVILGTVRTGRLSEHAAKFVAEVGRKMKEVEIIYIDPKDLELPDEGEVVKDAKYSKATEEADAFFIVTPEYNHGYPGTLKRMLDSELKNYIHKPVAVAGVSDGRWGGTRVIEHLAPILRELGLSMTFTDLHFPNVDKVFNEQGELQDEAFIERNQK